MKKGWIILGGLLIVSMALGLFAGRIIIPLKVENQTGDSRMKPSWLMANIFAIKQGYTGKFYKIVVRYTEEEQGRMNLYGGADGVLVQNFNYKVEGGVLTVWVYYNPIKRDEILTQEGWVNNDVWAMMCAAAEGPKRDECYQKASSFGEWSKKYLRLSLVPSAYAYSWCAGSISCGVWQTSCKCPDGSTCSTQNAACLSGGNCSCSTKCNAGAEVPLDCTGLSETNCKSTSEADCSQGGDCPDNQSCIWNACPDPDPCPSECGYEGGYVADGWCHTTKYCAPTASCCTATDPTLPVLSSPAQTTPLYQARVGVVVSMTWTLTDWGDSCNLDRHYDVCVRSTATGACDLVDWARVVSPTRTYSWTPSVADTNVNWRVRKDNGSNNVTTAANTFCVEGGDSISIGWSAWSDTCGVVTRTRTCTETCGNDDCIAFFAANCPVAGACTTSASGFVQTQSKCIECGCTAPLCGQAKDCGGFCASTDAGVPNTPTCTSLGEVTGTPQTISWTSGGVLADNYQYIFDGVTPAVSTGLSLSASVPVTCGSHTWRARAQNLSCGTESSTYSSTCTLERSCCAATAPDKPTIVCPATELTVGVTTVLDWNNIASWGIGCPTNSNNYNVCIDDNGVGCTNGYPSTGTTSQYSWTPAVADTAAYWAAIPSNGSLETWSDTCTVCVEGGYVLNEGLWTWPAACGNVSRSRTCSETCGTDDCNAFFASKVGCDVAANCSYVGNTQTETRCNECAPTAPTLTSPVSGAIKQIGDVVVLTWTANAWGSACPQPNINKFSVCVMSGAVCDLVNVDNTPLTGTTYNWTPLVADRVVTWKITASNGGLTTATSTTRTVCVEGPPSEPVQVSPLNGAEIPLGVAKVLNWNGVSWGIACPTNDNKYRVCVSSDTVSCDLVPWSTNSDNLGVDSKYTWTPGEVGDAYWAAIADNGTKETWSETWSVCVEGFNAADTNYVSAWSACGADHKRTRTCTEDCGVNDCAAVSLSEDCTGTITGTLFDASDLLACPGDIGTNPAYASIRFGNETFGINGPWPVISAPVATDVNGNYSESVYVPGVYSYDYTDLYASGRAVAVKFECTSPTVTVSTVGEVVVKDTGFWRTFGGWWQVTGGSVYAGGGVRSYIPASVSPVSNQKLILASSAALGSRTGVLSYGVPWVGNELGTNINAKVSTPLWRIQSLYDGIRFDYNYYKTRMDVFPSTDWDGTPFTYAGGGNGYQILKHTGDVSLGALTIGAGQKVILLIDGNVSINGNVSVAATGGRFLAVIASGDITFASTVTSAQGWFVAENINVPSGGGVDDPFDGRGSFVGWTGINLARDMGVGNNTAPAEKFTYRQDMYVNAPAPIKIYTKSFSPFIP